jgi:hypothetical protein
MLDEKWKAGFSNFRDRFEEDVFIQLNIHLLYHFKANELLKFLIKDDNIEIRVLSNHKCIRCKEAEKQILLKWEICITLINCHLLRNAIF